MVTFFPEVRVEVAFSYAVAGAGYFILDTSLLDTGTLATDYFLDVAEWVEQVSTQRGVSRHDGVYARAQAGRATVVLDNGDRRFDPTNLAGPYVSAGRTEIVPMRVFRFQATWAGVAYDLWRGFADEWRLDWSNADVAKTTLTGTDGTKVVSNYDSVAGSLVGGGETTGARINRILDNAGWPTTERAIDTGLTTVQSTDLADNAWTEILLTADTEIGEVYFDATNRLVFRNRHAILTDSRSATSQGIFGCDVGELTYDSVDVANDDTQVRNIVRVSRVGGTVQIVQDIGSIAEYQRKTWGRSDLIMETDAEAADYAAYVLSFSKSANLRFDSIRITPTTDPDNLWPQVLGRELGDRITIKFTPPGGPTDQWVDLPGTTGNYLSTPDSAALTPTTQVDLVARVALDDWTPAAEQVLVAKYGTTNLTRVWYMAIATTGRIRTRMGDGTVAPTVADSDVISPVLVDGATYWIRATFVASSVVSYYWSADDTNDPAEVTWTAAGTDVTAVAALGAATGTPVTIGGGSSGASPLAGNVYYAEVRTTVAGPAVASFDANATEATGAQTPTTVPSDTGETWTINGADWAWDATSRIIERDAFIRGIRHDVVAPGQWVTAWTLQDADAHLSFMVLDHAALGVLDANSLAY